ncbi:MAG TPA: 50S ribosomal protein L21 [Terriglobales bacterium]|nr:50S ribosomal protein L21 [Terriglobales bacterium]
MYAVIRAGGKQYRVAPGDVIRVEKLGEGQRHDGNVQFSEVLLVSGGEGEVSRPQSEASVTGRVLGEGRGDKVLVFHYKRKKQYKKMFGHRQPYTAVRITEIAFGGQRFTAPEEPERKPKPKKAAPQPEVEAGESARPQAKAEASAGAKKAKAKKSAAAKSKATAARKKKK